MHSDLHTALHDPAIYPDRPKAVTVIETSINFVALTEAFVYKIKRPVTLFDGRIDYRMLDARKQASEDEFALNLAIAPSVYLSVEPVTQRPDGSYVIGAEEGPIIDYALRMRRLPSEGNLEALLHQNELSVHDVQVLAKTLAALHQTLITSAGDPHLVSQSFFAQRWKETIAWIRATNSEFFFSEPLAQEVEQWVEAYWKMYGPRFAEGVGTQRIHGDLQLEHVYQEGTQIHCIDANTTLPEWRFGDTMNDLAALMKDFDAAGREDLSAIVQDAYCAEMNISQASVAHRVEMYRMYWVVIRLLVYAGVEDIEGRKHVQRYLYLVRRYLKTPINVLTMS